MRADTERQLALVRDRLEHLQRFAGVGYWELDPRTDPPYDVTFTEELYRIHGISPGKEFDLERGLEFTHPEDRPRIEGAVKRAIDEGEPYDLEARLVTPDGELRWFHTVCEPVEEDGEVVLLRGMLQDITARKRREQERQRTIDRVTDAIAQIDRDWRLTFIDDRAAELTGIDVEEELGRDFWELFPQALGTTFEDEYRHAMESREPTSFEEYFADLDAWFQVNVYPDDDGGLSFYFHDVTERKAYEREIEQHRERLEDFASVVSHDLRNPLNVAEGHLDLASQTGSDEALEKVADAHDRIRTLIDDLLALAQANEAITEPEPVHLDRLVGRCWEGVETRVATLERDVALAVLADESRLAQLLENLFRNAVEHGGDDVAVAVGELEDGFYVEDTGPGIPAAEREAVFESGYTTVSGGTGFGLAIVEQIAEAHGWEVALTEGAEGGARFELTGVARP